MKQFRPLLKVLVLLTFLVPFTAHAQDNSLDTKQKALDKLKSDKSDIDKKISAMEAEITAMKPARTWKYGGFMSLNVNQSTFVNWAAGGVPSVSATAVGNFYANYKKKNWSWNNTVDAAWGMIYANKHIRKNEDKMEINSKAGYDLQKKLSIAALMKFNSQFTPTYDYSSNNGAYPLKSYFAAPAYLTISLGLDYKPTSYFSLYFSPAAGKFTFVQRDPNIHEWAYGVDTGKVYRAEFGAYVSAVLTKDIVKNVSLWTKVDLFNNYTDKDKGNRKNIDIDWQTRINLKINKYLTANLFTEVLYDHNIAVPVESTVGGVTTKTLVNSKVQFREALGVGLSYKFNSKD
jgi:hypothetical protein